MERNQLSRWVLILISLGSLLLLGSQNSDVKSTNNTSAASVEGQFVDGGVILDISWFTIVNTETQWYQDVVSGEDIAVPLVFDIESGWGYSEGYGTGVHIGTYLPGSVAQIDTYGFWAVKWVVLAAFDNYPECTLTLSIREYNLTGIMWSTAHTVGISYSEAILPEYVGGYMVTFKKGQTHVFMPAEDAPGGVLFHRHFVLTHLFYPEITNCDL